MGSSSDRADADKPPMVGPQPQGERFRWAVDFAIDGDLRFLSHRDVIRLFSRALARTALSVRMSRGFNPRPYLSLPLPRPVGVASLAERLILDLCEPISAEALTQKLSAQMPDSLHIRTAFLTQDSNRCQPQAVTYVARIDPSERGELENHILLFLGQSSVLIERENPEQRSSRSVNIRPYVRSLELTEEGLRMELWVSGQGGAKPMEVCQSLGMNAEGINARLLRTEILWS